MRAGEVGDDGVEDDMACKLSEGDIFGTLKKQLAKINVCVEDEKGRDAANLPPTLELEFVVKPTGAVTEFHINDRHYRTGPMNNCMIKAFNTIHFPESTGTNCPVTIPIKIGSRRVGSSSAHRLWAAHLRVRLDPAHAGVARWVAPPSAPGLIWLLSSIVICSARRRWRSCGRKLSRCARGLRCRSGWCVRSWGLSAMAMLFWKCRRRRSGSFT